MRVLKVEGKTGESRIMLGESIRELGAYCRDGRAVVVTDSRMRGLLAEALGGFEIIEIGEGEGAKTLDTVRQIYGRMVELELDRGSFLVGVGGGIVCDIAGFAASTFMRGIRFGFVPTTLLAQVDASVGGKNGVNYEGYKNLVGTFSQPEFVICDFELLKTLPKREISCGLAEIIKSAAISDSGLFSYLEGKGKELFLLERPVVEKIVHDSLVVKARIVSLDEKEKGERRKLNFGHTIGHAIEKTTGIPHGEAISIGMVVAARLSVKKGLLGEEDASRIEALLGDAGLPVKIDAEKEAILDAIRKDKKREGGKINFVLLRGIGEAVVEEIGIDELEEVANDM